MQTGIFNTMKIDRFTQSGAYLVPVNDQEHDGILLPGTELDVSFHVGDVLEAFVYRDSEDRLIATLEKPLAKCGEVAYLKVKETNRIGAFLDWGLKKDLLLPTNEQTLKIQKGKSYVVYVKLDRHDRVMATMSISNNLKTDSPFKKDDSVFGMVYKYVRDIGAFVAVENTYSGLIPEKEIFKKLSPGDIVEARITKVKTDGKIDLSIRKKSHIARVDDAEIIRQALLENSGYLHLNDKSSPDEIKGKLQMSKAAFKRAVGKLLKEKAIAFTDDGIKLVNR